MSALNYLRRYGGVMPQLWSTGREGEVFEDAFQTEDRDAVLAIAADLRGVFSAGLVRFWLDRQPKPFRCTAVQIPATWSDSSVGSN
jgi:predicted oxidoreductase